MNTNILTPDLFENYYINFGVSVAIATATAPLLGAGFAGCAVAGAAAAVAGRVINNYMETIYEIPKTEEHWRKFVYTTASFGTAFLIHKLALSLLALSSLSVAPLSLLAFAAVAAAPAAFGLVASVAHRSLQELGFFNDDPTKNSSSLVQPEFWK